MTPIFVINLARSSQRLTTSQQQLALHGLDFERIEAVDGNKLSNQQVDAHYCSTLNKQRYHQPLRNGQIGCYLSHRKAWQTIVDRQLDFAIVLEDDFKLDRTIHSAMNNIKRLNQPWQLIKLAAYNGRAREICFQSAMADQQYLVVHNKLMSGCCATAISYQGAKQLLAATEKFGRPVDCDLQHVWETNTYGFSLLPYPVTQLQGQRSDIASCSPARKIKKSFWRRKKQQIVSGYFNTIHTHAFIKSLTKQYTQYKKGTQAPLHSKQM